MPLLLQQFPSISSTMCFQRGGFLTIYSCGTRNQWQWRPNERLSEKSNNQKIAVIKNEPYFLQLSMNRLGQLLRPTIAEPALRKKSTGINMAKRKQLRRLKKINIHSRQFTGEQNPHGWFTPKRFKAMGVYLQTCRNVHPGTLPIDPKLKKQISEVFVEDSHWSYWAWRNYETQMLRQDEIRRQSMTAQDLAQLPPHFRQELGKTDVEEEPMPKICNTLFTHNSQINIYMPQDERNRMNLILKIVNPPINKDQQDADNQM